MTLKKNLDPTAKIWDKRPYMNMDDIKKTADRNFDRRGSSITTIEMPAGTLRVLSTSAGGKFSPYKFGYRFRLNEQPITEQRLQEILQN